MCRIMMLWVVAWLLSGLVNAQVPPNRMVWTGDPLRVPLSNNVEQRLTFPDAKLLWADVPNKLKDKLTTQIVGNNVYWTAKGTFKRQRITLGEEGSDKIYLLDVSANNRKTNTARIVVMRGSDPYASTPQPAPPINSQVDSIRKASRSPMAGYATLLRFAASEVYAPQRLRMRNTGIVKVSLSASSVHNLLPQRNLSIKTVAAWRSQGFYVTALNIVNVSKNNVRLDPRAIRGMWKASLFHHNFLRGYGSRDDNTTLFLISDKPFNDAINSHPMIQLGG